jgi:hypothetical protein
LRGGSAPFTAFLHVPPLNANRAILTSPQLASILYSLFRDKEQDRREVQAAIDEFIL